MVPVRIHLRAIATCSILAGGISILPIESILAQDQHAPTSPDDPNAKVISLLAQIESVLVNGEKPLDGEITRKLVTATSLASDASPATKKLLSEFPARLRKDADKQRHSGDPLGAINLDVFADASSGFLAEHVGKSETLKPPALQVIAPSVPAPASASAQQQRTLVERGDAMLRLGDVSAARMLFQRAADSGLGIAALKLADTYDAEFLAEHKLRGVKPDPTAAEQWYRTAAGLGETRAANRLKALEGNRLANLLSTQ